MMESSAFVSAMVVTMIWTRAKEIQTAIEGYFSIYGGL